MRVRIQVIVASEANATPVVPEVATRERGPLQPEGLGLMRAEANDRLRGVQETMVSEQVTEFLAQQERTGATCTPSIPRPGRRGRST